jgi:hypothetical protein
MQRFRLSATFLTLLVAFGAIGAAACQNDEPKPKYQGDGTPGTPVTVGTTEGGVDSAVRVDANVDAADGGTCSELTITGFLVDRTGINGEPPVSLGGTVADGTYDLTTYNVYVGVGGVAGPTGLSARSSIRIANNKIEQILESSGSGPAVTTARTKSSYTATGAAFVTTQVCPNAALADTLQYTSTDANLILTDPIAKEAFTFVKR